MTLEEMQNKINSALEIKKLTKEELRKELKIKGEEDLKVFEEILKEKEEDGALYLDDKDYYHLFDAKIPYIHGQVFVGSDCMGHFIGKKNGKKVKFRILHDDLNGVLDGDTILIKDKGRTKYDRRLGEVIKIIKRKEKPSIFKYLGDGLFSLYNETSEVFIRKNPNKCQDLVVGTLVTALTTKEPIVDNIFEGDILRVCGHIDDPKALETAISLTYGFDYRFSDVVEKTVQKLPDFVTEKETKDRIDLRKEKIFTIDGDDTKDIDDAVSIKKKGDHYILKVHIADVSYYTYRRTNKVLFEESISRGNSAYFADSVVPMLPHKISNGICSLNPNADRLAKTIEIEFDENGNVVNSKLYKSVIRSQKQMTYDAVDKIINGEEVPGYEEYKDDLLLMNQLAKKLQKKRQQDGALSFFDYELKIKTDIYGKVSGISPIIQSDARKIIENFMILANTEFTNHMGYLYSPFIFRVHPSPNYLLLKATLEEIRTQDIDIDLNKLIEELQEKLNFQKDNIQPREIEKLLLGIQDKDYFEPISSLILKSMQRAYYFEENIGHYGLANPGYTHFTSPIRRAADQVNHVICDLVMEYNSTLSETRHKEILQELDELEKRLPDICEHISETERLADELEKEIENIKKLEYFEENMADYEGPILGKIIYSSKAGVIVKVGPFEALVPHECMEGFKYRKESRTYMSSDESIRLGDEAYVFDPDVLKERELIIYNSISKDEEKLIAPERPKRLIKTKKLETK